MRRLTGRSGFYSSICGLLLFRIMARDDPSGSSLGIPGLYSGVIRDSLLHIQYKTEVAYYVCQQFATFGSVHTCSCDSCAGNRHWGGFENLDRKDTWAEEGRFQVCLRVQQRDVFRTFWDQVKGSHNLSS